MVAFLLGISICLIYRSSALLDSSDDSEVMPYVDDSMVRLPGRRDITDLGSLTDAQGERNETAYELKILEKMSKMDRWVQKLSAGERTRIEEVSPLCWPAARSVLREPSELCLQQLKEHGRPSPSKLDWGNWLGIFDRIWPSS